MKSCIQSVQQRGQRATAVPLTKRSAIEECRLATAAADGALVRLAKALREAEDHGAGIAVEGLRDHVLCVLARLRKVTGGAE